MMACPTDGSYNEVKEALKAHLRTSITEGTIIGDWKPSTRSIIRHLPCLTVKLSRAMFIDVYDRNIGNAAYEGALADLPFSVHIFHSNCMEDGEEKGKYAQDVARRVINCLCPASAPVGCDVYDLSARESEVGAGAHRISRVIVEGRINIKRLG